MYPIIKRVFDFSSSLILLILLSPILISIMLVLKFTGEGEIFYVQERIGYKNYPFRMFKFATMLKNSANMQMGTVTVVNDPRVTKAGRFLRKSKLNELPQIYNVIIGNLSVVGPRPLPEKEVSQFANIFRTQIYNTRPGITGISSLIFRDEESVIENNSKGSPKSYYINVILPYKGELEIWYQNNISFLTDIKILILTFVSILFPNKRLAYKYFKTLPSVPRFMKF